MANNPTIIAASLNDAELRNSIDKLVKYVGDQSLKMAQEFDAGVKLMKESLSSLGGRNINISFGNNNSKISQTQKTTTQAVKETTAAINNQTTSLDGQAQAIQKATANSSKYTTEVLKQAQAIRASKEWQEKGRYFADNGDYYYDKEKANVTRRQREILLSLEDQIVMKIKQREEAERSAATAARAAASEAQHVVTAEERRMQIASTTNEALRKSREIRQQINAESSKTDSGFIARLESANKLNEKLKELRKRYSELTFGGRMGAEGTNIAQNIRVITREVQKYQQQLMRPSSLKEALGLSEKTLDDIAYKMKMLNAYRSGIDLTKLTAASDIKKVDEEINRLQKDMDKYMAKSKGILETNTALGRSWNYMKNRLAFYFTVGASTQFVRNLIEIRSQYEMNERALGILIDSAERGTQIFNELSNMALVSPYTLIELSTAAKQLTAYDIAAKDVVDTTRRLADMASAVGIPIERLTYALGQIKAYGYLNSRDARMFSNAGIPLIKQLSEYYTELEGRMVSTADVYDRMKKKAIDYGDVMQVITKMTDEGGKFFDFQAKMAETLKVQLANLTLAWNNMLNDIGESNQGLLSGGIGVLKQLFLHWKELNKVLNDLVVIVGSAVAANMLLTSVFGKSTAAAIRRSMATMNVTAADRMLILSNKNLTATEAKLLIAMFRNDETLKKQIVSMKLLTQAEADAAAKASILRTTGFGMAAGFRAASVAVKTLVTSLMAIAPQIAGFVAIMGIVDFFQTWSDYGEQAKEANKAIAESAKESAKSIKDTIYQLNASGVSAQNATNLAAEEQKKAWDTIRGEIELSAASAERFITILLSEPDLGKRIQLGFGALEAIQHAHEIMALWHDDAITVSEDFKVLGIGADGLTEDLKDFVKYLNASEESATQLEEISSGIEGTWRQILSWVYDYSDIMAKTGVGLASPIGWAKELAGFLGIDTFDPSKAKIADSYNELSSEIEKTYASLVKQIQRDEVENQNEIYEIITKTISNIATQRNLSEQETLTLRLLLEDKFAKSGNAIFEQAVADRSTAWNAWMKFLTTRHKTEFTNMRNEEITQESWAQDKRKKMYEETFEKFKQYNILAYNQIKDTVNDLSQMQVHIKVFYDEQNQPSWLQQDFKKRVPTSTLNVKEYKTVTDLISGEQKALKEANEEMKNLRAAGVSELDTHFLDVKNRAAQATEALDAYNAAHEKETKKVGGGSKKDELAEALQKEIQLVKELQSNYDKLLKSGASSTQALAIIRQSYGSTISMLNATLRKAGLQGLDLDMIKGKDPHTILQYFEQLRQDIESKGLGNLKRMDLVEGIIKTLRVDVQTYDLKKVTDGLNNELGKLKDEYELAVELDANPELGGIFADLIGIDKAELDKLPKDFQGVMNRLQTIIDETMKDDRFELLPNLNKTTFDNLLKARQIDASSELAQRMKAIVDYANKVRKDETTKQIDDWKKLLEKYAEYEYKRNQIIETARRERETARKKGASDSIMQAIDNREKQELARLDFEEFQKSSYWVTATGDLAKLSNNAIGLLIQRLEEYKKKAKNLDPKQIKQLNSALSKLYKEQRKNNPFKAIGDMLQQARERVADYQSEIDELERKIQHIEILKNLGIATDAQLESLPKLIEKLKELKAAQESVGEIDATDWVESINATVSAVKAAVSVFDDLAKAIGGVNTSDVDKVFSVLEKGGQGAAIGAQFGGYGALIGGALGVATSLVEILANADNERINRKIKESETAVKRLEVAYVDLQQAIDKAYGAGVVGAKRAMAAAKELQLVELERQLALERSRSSKNRDDDRILELQKEIKELRYEIQGSIREITDDLLGSDVGTFAENLVSSMIDAFKQGEDYMKVFEESFDKMIDNMIMKSIVSRVVAQYLDQIWNGVDARIQARTQNQQEEYMKALEEANNMETMDFYEWLKKNGRLGDFEIASISGRHDIIEQLRAMYEAEKAAAKAAAQAAKDNLDAASGIDNTDISWLIEELNKIRPELGERLKEILGEYYTFGQESDKQLSALQQGIQGITEDTAGAIEGYLNIISQRMFEHGNVLYEIRDVLLNLNTDVQMGVQAQMLLQLQNSYAVQVAIQNILNGVLTPSGRAFVVELNS